MNRALEMEVFVAVVDAGSFVRAGDALAMSKAAVSRHVDALERRLGVRLLQRTTRRLSLTEEGNGFYHHCKEILAAIEAAEAEATSRVLEPSGTVRINAPVSFAVRYMGPVWREVLHRYPKIEVDLTLTDRVVDLIDEGVDLAVRIGELADSSLVSRRFATTNVVLAASPGYLARHGTPQTPVDLLRHQIIAYRNWTGPGRDEWTFTPRDGSDPVRLRLKCRVFSNSGDPCRQIALADGGIVLQPDFLIGDDLREGRLQPLLLDYAFPELGMYAVYPSRKQLPQKVRAVVNLLSELFEHVPWTRVSDLPAFADMERKAGKRA
ncbi:LysR family transcriptional regulator [Lampropedia cohaerens]|uniref:LysR family transcriptional regulator n=1 Tax=Lampropedia cohaerens TaxID=1610491 RepID=A0A0U1Q0I2_9BURK|nr:LysR family transcriptional regulator [Lampropedia cohaerens]KKW68267.1 LysR family transcriptional regulator [Lampropedia cohaerens]